MTLRFYRFLLPAILLVLWLTFSASKTALAEPLLNEIEVEYIFGGPVAFRAHLETEQPVHQAFVFLRSQGENRTIVGPAAFEDGVLEYIHDQPEQPLRAFAKIEYWFQVTFADGSDYTSESYTFIYDDNRFNWRLLSSEPFHIHWYEGDLDFAQGVLDVAHEGLKRANSILPLPAPPEVNIYVYSSSEELQATRRLSRREGVAGHAEVDLGVMVVSLPNLPERRLEAERQVPHELMHILLYQAIDRGYENIPAWLNEGLASINELYPTPDYQIVLESAYAQNSLIPISDLCRGFPPEMSNFILSYAESAYFTRFLYRTFGALSLETLLAGYANGLDCERGFEAAYGMSLATAEAQWLKEVFGGPSMAQERFAGASGEFWTWMVLLIVVLALPFLLTLLALGRSRSSEPVGHKGVAGG